jgi:hypothetical protein
MSIYLDAPPSGADAMILRIGILGWGVQLLDGAMSRSVAFASSGASEYFMTPF